MILEVALNAWLSDKTNLDCYWMQRPSDKDIAVVYRTIGYGEVEGNLRKTGISEDNISISVYHSDADIGKALAQLIRTELHYFSGDLSGYAVQKIEFSGGFDEPVNDGAANSYAFHRDFIINHTLT